MVFIVYTWDNNSLTRANNSYTYLKNTICQAKNLIFAIEKALESNIPYSIVEPFIY